MVARWGASIEPFHLGVPEGVLNRESYDGIHGRRVRSALKVVPGRYRCRKHRHGPHRGK